MATAVTSVAVLRAVRAAAAARVPVLLWGEPGIGKTAVVEALAAADDAPLEVVVGSLREPSDLNGLPVVDGDMRGSSGRLGVYGLTVRRRWANNHQNKNRVVVS